VKRPDTLLRLAWHAAAVLTVLVAQCVSTVLLAPLATDDPPVGFAGDQRLYHDSVSDFPALAYSTFVLSQAFTHPEDVREDHVKSWICVLPIVGLSKSMSASLVSRWSAVRLAVQLSLLALAAALAYGRLRRRLGAREAGAVAGKIPMWWLVMGVTAWLYVHLAITSNVPESFAERLEPVLVVFIGAHVLAVGMLLSSVLAGQGARLRIPLPLLFLDLVGLEYLVVTHGFPYRGWYDTWPPGYLNSWIYAWPPVGRAVAWLYPVLAQPSAALIRHPAPLSDLSFGLKPPEFLLVLACVNAVAWALVLIATWAATKIRWPRPAAA
jgi:hypothetical protein